jgi:hypothetical protein
VDDECIHGLQPSTCSICVRGNVPKVSQRSLNIQAIAEAVAELAAHGEFRTKGVAQHPGVQSAHPDTRSDARFDQQIGTYLTEATGRLRIKQISEKGRSNARWALIPTASRADDTLSG